MKVIGRLSVFMRINNDGFGIWDFFSCLQLKTVVIYHVKRLVVNSNKDEQSRHERAY